MAYRADEVAEHHHAQLEMFREAVTSELASVLEAAGSPEVLFSGTMTCQSGPAVAMLAPLDQAPLPELLDTGGPVAVFLLTEGSQQTRLAHRLEAGVYVLELAVEDGGAVRLDFRGAAGAIEHSVPGILAIPGVVLGLEDIKEKIREWLKKHRGIDIKILDFEILFGGGRNEPSEVRASVGPFSFHLFDDP